MVKNKFGHILGKAAENAVFIIFSILCIAPVILLIAISLSDSGEILKHGYSFIPRGFNVEAYKFLFKDVEKIANAYKITLYTTVFGTLGSMICTVLLAYVISRKSFYYKKAITWIIFFTMLFHAGMFPSYYWVTNGLKLKNSLLALIFPGFVVPWNILLMKSFFLSLPDELSEAAMIDGCDNFKILFKIVLPLSKSALATVGLFTILRYFNDWQSSMLYMTDSSRISVQYFLYKTMNNIQEAQKNMYALTDTSQKFPTEPVRMAIAVLVMVPIVGVFPFLQKYFVKGITLGSVKG